MVRLVGHVPSRYMVGVVSSRSLPLTVRLFGSLVLPAPRVPRLFPLSWGAISALWLPAPSSWPSSSVLPAVPSSRCVRQLLGAFRLWFFSVAVGPVCLLSWLPGVLFSRGRRCFSHEYVIVFSVFALCGQVTRGSVQPARSFTLL